MRYLNLKAIKMSLDQTLMEIEPIFRGTDNTFQFTHPSFQEVLTAKQFANEINSGELSVRDAYEHFWSYEDAPLNGIIGVEGRYILPAWHNIILFLAGLLPESEVWELVSIISETYSCADSVLAEGIYNPFEDDHRFMYRIASKNPGAKKKLGQSFVDQLLAAGERDQIRLFGYIGDLGYYDARIHQVMPPSDTEVWKAKMKALGKLGFISKELGDATYFFDDFAKQASVDLLKQVTSGDPLFASIAQSSASVPDFLIDSTIAQYRGSKDEREVLYGLLWGIKSKAGLRIDSLFGEAIKKIHQRLKPKGYVAGPFS